MSYMALYRKWRPGEFNDVKGQEHIVTTLTNQITADRVGHAYLFCGTRGTGKTTIAKLFAKAVNCLHPIDGSPCNECSSCMAIANQSSLNVIEIDAASNNGVDNIREIRDQVQYSPAEGKFKVYIIDEVHMLSMGAFNALLKTLEEPPSYVIFILATTEAHKIPVTILSRCQRYDFKRISIDTISDRLTELMVKENTQVEEKAIRYIAKAADGSMRDALSLLDQCIAFYLGKTLTYDNVLEVLGAVDTTVFSHLLRMIVANDVLGAIKLLEEIIMTGRELGQFVTDFIWYLRNLLLLKNAGDDELMLDMSSENLILLKEESQMIENDALMRYIRIISELASQIKYSAQKRVLVEMAFIRLCKPEMEINLDSIVERLKTLEKQVEQGVVTPAVQPVVSNPVKEEIVQHNFDVDEELNKRFPPADAQVLKELASQWKMIIKGIGHPMRGYLEVAAVTVSDTGNEIRLVFDPEDHLAKSYFERQTHMDELEAILSGKAGKEIKLQCVFKSIEKTGTFENFDLSTLSKLNIPIEFENE